MKNNESIEKVASIVFDSNKINQNVDIDIESFDYKIQFKGNVNETYLFKKNEDSTGTLLNEYDKTITYDLDEIQAFNLFVLILDLKAQL